MGTVRAGRAVVCLLAAALLAACSNSSGAPSASQAAAPKQVDLTKAKAELDKSKADIRAVIDNIARTSVQNLRPPFGPCTTDVGTATANRACTMFDEASACDAGSTQPWPQRWGYNLSVELVGSDALPVGISIRKTLINDKWTWAWHDNPNTTAIADYGFTKGGASIHLIADDLPGVLTIEGYSPCIVADGSVRGS
jgi:hypothetical protein